MSKPLSKVLIANRGEIAVRVARAAAELGLRSVAVYAHEDRNARHRLAADESFPIGEPGRPVRAYLDVDELVRVASASGCDAVHPGYGFLSENVAFAEACQVAGLVFVGPPPAVLAATGDKVAARTVAVEAGVPLPRATSAVRDLSQLDPLADMVGYPLFVKAVAGGGGRGMRRVGSPAELRAAVDAAMREAGGAFGVEEVFLEEAVEDARHIEVQILADATGEVVHLFERDCSLQRRHQKVVELAPAPALDPDVRRSLCEDAVRYARHLRFEGAGTVEFLVDGMGRHFFIEMNPRVQVEHTVTEEVTGVDIVRAQLAIAGGATLAELGLTQEAVRVSGAALQCRVTTEVPSAGFAPDAGRITACRVPGGPGVRVDEAALFAGAEIPPFFDSLLAKVTCRGVDVGDAVARARRALGELRVEGVRTNIGFLQKVLADPAVAAGAVRTTFLAERPDLVAGADGTVDPAEGLARWAAEMTVTRPHGEPPSTVRPAGALPPLPDGAAPSGSRTLLSQLGAAEFARRLREQEAVAITDTTFRDAHQSLLATRLRTFDMLAVAPHVARTLPGLWSVEAWGGATFDVALRFLAEDPWERLARLREALPNICIQMLLRGRNTVAYEPSSEAVCRAFVEEAAATGVDVFRVFDALNDVDQMLPAVEAVLAAGAVCEGTLCYTGDLASPAEQLYTLDYYLRLAERLVERGVHVLCIKDMAGLLRAPAAARLVAALRERFDQPVHLHTHDTAGGQLATYMAAVEAGVDAVDGAAAPLAGTTSQPSLAAIVAATAGTPRESGLDLAALNDLEPYWEAVRSVYAPFEMGLRSPTGRVYDHEVPGGQLSNLRQQAVAVGLGDRFADVLRLYQAADRLLGRITKVTPTSKVVGDLALALASCGVSPAEFEADPGAVDLPASVLAFLRGDLGDPPGGWPEPLRARALEGRRLPPTRQVDIEPAVAATQGPARRSALNQALFPAEAAAFAERRARYGDLSLLPTDVFLYGLDPGEERVVELGRGRRTSFGVEAVTREDGGGVVAYTVDGAPRLLSVAGQRGSEQPGGAEKADAAVPGQVGAPFAGVVTLRCSVGDAVKPGTVLATIEAMKLESSVTAPAAGRVARVAVSSGQTVALGDLLVVVEPEPTEA